MEGRKKEESVVSITWVCSFVSLHIFKRFTQKTDMSDLEQMEVTPNLKKNVKGYEIGIK